MRLPTDKHLSNIKYFLIRKAELADINLKYQLKNIVVKSNRTGYTGLQKAAGLFAVNRRVF